MTPEAVWVSVLVVFFLAFFYVAINKMDDE